MSLVADTALIALPEFAGFAFESGRAATYFAGLVCAIDYFL